MFAAQILIMLAAGPIMIEDNLGPYVTKLQCENRLDAMVDYLQTGFQEHELLVPEIKRRCKRHESMLL